MTSTTKIINIYLKDTFKVSTPLMYLEFDLMYDGIDSMGGPSPNMTADKENKPDIERTIRDIKERIQDLNESLTFNSPQRRVVIYMVKFLFLWLNEFTQETQ